MRTPADLLQEDRFIEWVTSEGKLHDDYWQQWIATDPQRVQLVAEARELVQQLNAVPRPAVDAEAAWQDLQPQLRPIPKMRRMHWWRAAAAAALLVLASWWWWPVENTYQTAYGELQRVELPDGTVVDLRANSKLWWSGDWADGGLREVHLEGEAYFDVTSADSQQGMAFHIHASPLEVRVLGTEFSLSNRKDATALALVEGKVAVQTENSPEQQLVPNQRYQWSAVEGRAQVDTFTNAQTYTAWRAGVWHFEQTPFRDIVQQLEDNYGKTVIVRDQDLLDKKLTGAAPATRLEGLVNSIAASLGVQVSLEVERIEFR
ncbi:MAG: FecR domain-containing protein [Bacteroidota bacterium]